MYPHDSKTRRNSSYDGGLGRNLRPLQPLLLTAARGPIASRQILPPHAISLQHAIDNIDVHNSEMQRAHIKNEFFGDAKGTFYDKHSVA